jgi:class 3 adenylate cyclase
MADPPPQQPPEHPDLRELAIAIEAHGLIAEIQDSRFRAIWGSSQLHKSFGLTEEDIAAYEETSRIVRSTTGSSELMRVTRESGTAWFNQHAPLMRHYLKPEDPDFEEVFGPSAELAAGIEAAEHVPRAWHNTLSFASHIRVRDRMVGEGSQLYIRLNDDQGEFIGVLVLDKPNIPDSLILSLARGDKDLFERMEQVSEPAKRPAAILFADLEASGDLSRRISSRGYFELVRELTDLIDESVVSGGGIVGKHAGDGASALFLPEQFEESDSRAARAAIEAANKIRAGAAELGPGSAPVQINVGIHWGATLMIGQIATRGRLEVTAMGDQMNECARIESAARNGAVLASKEALERLTSGDAEVIGIDPDSIAYTPVSEFPGLSDKARRDAGSVAVGAI